MTRYELDVHADDRDMWRRMTGRDETQLYDMPRMRDVECILASAERNGLRVTAREIGEEPS